jgi:drug/metabolite transporter (DMT)-like permease
MGKHFSSVDLWLLGVVFIWGINFSIVKTTLREMSPLSFNSLRFALAVTLVFSILRLTEKDLTVERRDWPKFLFLGFIGNTLHQIFFIKGIYLTTASNSALILSIGPVFVALLNVVFRLEKVSLFNWYGILLSFLGVFLIILGGTQGKGLSFSKEYLQGDLLTLAAAFFWSVRIVFSKPLLQKYSYLKVTTCIMACGTPFLILASVKELAHQDWSRVSFYGWLGFVYSFSLAIAGSYIIWHMGLKKIGSAKTAVYSNLTPVVSVVFAWLFLGEHLTLLQGLGGIAILGGIYLTRLSR